MFPQEINEYNLLRVNKLYTKLCKLNLFKSKDKVNTDLKIINKRGEIVFINTTS